MKTDLNKGRLLGGHMSAAGGIFNAIANGEHLGCSAIQLFGSSPRVWEFRMPGDEELKKYLDAKARSTIRFVVLHSIYLINLATPDERRRQKAIDSLVNYLELGKRMGADGVVTHIGTATGIDTETAIKNSASTIEKVLQGTPGGIPLVLEVTAGSGNTIGSKYEHIKAIIDQVGEARWHQRIRVCWDTAHTFASGYDIANNPDGVLNEFDRLLGLERMTVVHFNDSKSAFDSKVDRHENLGEGKLSLPALKRIVNHPKLKKLPFIMEVPGFDRNGVDVKNMRVLRDLIE